MKRYADKKVNVEVKSVDIAIKISKDDAEKFYDMWYLKNNNFLEAENAESWMTEHTIGNITGNMLDE